MLNIYTSCSKTNIYIYIKTNKWMDWFSKSKSWYYNYQLSWFDILI